MSESNLSHTQNPIDLLLWDINFAISRLTTQLTKQEYNRLYIKSDRVLFDLSAFTSFIEMNALTNLARVKDILDKSLKIVFLHNEEFIHIERKRLAEPLVFLEPDGLGFKNVAVPFECIRIRNKTISYVTPVGYQDFFFPDPDCYDSSTFAQRCSLVINTITAFFSELKDMTFYSSIVNDLYVQNTMVDDTLFTSFDYIEEKQKVATHKGKVFYENILNELPKHWRANMPVRKGQQFSDDCLKYVAYCKGKIAELILIETSHAEKLIDPMDLEKGIGYEKIDTVYQNQDLPIEISVIYHRNHLSGNLQATFHQYQGKDFSFMLDSLAMQWFLDSINNRDLYNDDCEVQDHITVQPFLKKFAEGFVNGYTNFDSYIKERVGVFNNDSTVIVEKIFEYITGPICTIETGLMKFGDKEIITLRDNLLFKSGINAGRFYKAWFFIINNSKLFVSRFKSHEPFQDIYRSVLNKWESQHRFKFQYEKLLKAVSDIEKFNTYNKGNSLLKRSVVAFNCFEDIFLQKDWRKYVDAFKKTTPPLLNDRLEFIGNRKKHIGVICGWFYYLKNQGIINANCSRSTLAAILNNEIKDFNMGRDGKTFDNPSMEYNKFEPQLISITK